jgi:hypothetical protein
MRIATPCSENLDAMPRDAQGDYLCGKCDRAVVDLRRAPRKRALSVIAGLRRQGDGSVCVRVNAKRDGTPVFAPDPSPLARFVGPIALVGSLAACSPQMSARDTTPVTLVAHEGSNSNLPSGTQTQTTTVVGTQPQPGGVQNVNVMPPDITPMAGGLAFSD